MVDVQRGDILVQYKGEPWTSACRLFTGEPFPHAVLVLSTNGNRINFLENGKSVSGPARIQEGWFSKDTDNVEVWRPKCDSNTIERAIEWIYQREGEPYGFGRMISLALTYRLGWSGWEGFDDDNPAHDNRRMVCSETIAMAYYRAGYDVAPHVSNRQTMPWDLRCTASELIT